MADDTNYDRYRPPSNRDYRNREEDRGDPPPTYEATTYYPMHEQGPHTQYNPRQQPHSHPTSYSQQQVAGQNTYRQAPQQESVPRHHHTDGQTSNRHPPRPDTRSHQQPNDGQMTDRQPHAQAPPQVQNHSLPPIPITNDPLQGETSSLTQSGSTNIISVSQQDLRARLSSEYNRRQEQGQEKAKQTSKDIELKMSTVDESVNAIIADIDEVKAELKRELETRRALEKNLAETEKEKRDLNSKLAALRVKLGVANANINVGKSEIDQIRTKFQEAKIHKARLEERINTCNIDLERMRDPNNPESNVNMKKLVSNDRKEIRKLRLELECVHEERDETHKQLIDKEMKIKELELLITQAAEKKERVQTDLELAISHKELEYLERQEIEKKYNELLAEKKVFDEKVSGIKDKIGATSSGMNDMQRQAEVYRKKEETTRGKIDKLEKQLRDVLTEIEQLKSKGRGMPARIAGSIKDHQYRMSKGGKITDTIPAGKVSDVPVKPIETEKSSSVTKSGGKGNLSNFVPPPKAKGVSPRTKLR